MSDTGIALMMIILCILCGDSPKRRFTPSLSPLLCNEFVGPRQSRTYIHTAVDHAALHNPKIFMGVPSEGVG